MALGDNSNGNNKNNNESTFFSRIRFKNEDLSFGAAFWKGMLKLSITQIKQGYNGNEFDELAYIHLSPTKALMLRDILINLKSADYKDTKVYGIDTGVTDTRNIIAFGIDPTSTKDAIKRYVVIGKVDPSGQLQRPTKFYFNVDYNFHIEWTDFEKMECVKSYNNNTEIDLLINVLDQFVKAMTGAMSYSVMDMNRFDNSRINTKLDLVMDALHIERKGSKSSGGDQSNSYFNRNGGAASPENSNRGRSNSTSIESIEDMMS